MNASPHHSKVKVSLTMGNRIFVAGTSVTGQMEVECRADQGLALSIMMVELFAIQELTSRDHSATSTFIHTRRLFQGPGLPPSNAVQAHPLPGDPQYPNHYYQARRGCSTFPFKLPVPSTSPSSITFGSGLAKVRYEVRATVGVFWKGEKRLVTAKNEVDLVESYEEDFSRAEPEAVVVGENGKIWAQGRVVGGVVVAGESACVELQVKNHSTKKNTGLTIALSRSLVLPGLSGSGKPPLQIADTLASVAFKGPEYIIPPGAEGVASLVFDVPKHARGVRGGPYEGSGQNKKRDSEAIFEIRCILEIKMTMGITGKDIVLEIPVPVVHPLALPELSAQEMLPPPQASPYAMYASPPPPAQPYVDTRAQSPWVDYRATSPYAMPYSPITSPVAYYDQVNGQVWLPPPSVTPQPYQYLPPTSLVQPYQQSYYPVEAQLTAPPPPVPPRPSSAGATRHTPDGLPPNVTGQHTLLPLASNTSIQRAVPTREEGKGERASRITQTLHQSSRNRSVSPQAHRHPVPPSSQQQPEIPPANFLVMQNLPPSSHTDATSQSSGEAVLHSPRPMLTPKHSFTDDPNMRPRSENVTDLESMADEIGKKVNDLSGDLPRSTFSPPPVDPSARYQKPTLAALGARISNAGALSPPPPPPPEKDQRRSLPVLSRRSTAQDLGAKLVDVPVSPIAQDPQAPPTPTLTAVRPPPKKRKSATYLSAPSGSGLDALEAKLLAQVGTRKADDSKKVPDVRSVLSDPASPIEIPKKKDDDEMMDESAISSLTLANELAGNGPLAQEQPTHEQVDRDWEEKTHQGTRSNGPLSDVEDKDRRKDKGRAGTGENKKHKERTQQKKSATNGRVAAWLGGVVDADIPSPPPTVATPSPAAPVTSLPDEPETSAVALPGPAEQVQEAEEEKPDAPNPRSSGFVAIGTYKREDVTYRRVSRFRTAESEARKVTDIWGSDDGAKTNGQPGSPPSGRPSPQKRDGDKTPRMQAAQAPRFPPVPGLDPEVKYDIRSARGGRGGKVTAVAALWASGAVQGAQSSGVVRVTKPTSKPSPEPKRLARPPALVKSISAQPAVSSSHAKPHISTTASLARPALTTPKPRLPPTRIAAIAEENNKIEESKLPSASLKLPTKPTFSKTRESLTNLSAPKSPPPPPPRQSLASEGLAFGQARLRDLIRRYQGTSGS